MRFHRLHKLIQSAGIHGRPFKSFDGVEPQPGNQNNGYCTHVSILFPTWHRPYLALYEQILYGTIQEIAQRYPTGAMRDRYSAAAVKFRIPYWDWAATRSAGEKILPDSIVQSSGINVNGPNGRQLIANPLYSYRFQPLDPAQLPNNPFNHFVETLRYPDNNGPSAVSQDDIATRSLENSVMSIRSRMYAILTNYHDYLAFSNGGYRAEAPPSEQDSVEAIHDQVHTLLGGGGHMSFIDYAGFDPVFFLHHTMIDRCFAMWQVLNPDSFVTPRVAVSDTFTMALGQIQNANSSLTPFYKDRSGNFWSSSDVRDMRIFGYEYPETSNNNAKAREQNVIVAINRLYGPPVSGQIFKRDLDAKSISASGKYREWVANLQMPKSALGAPFSVYIFLGPFNDDPKYWSSDPNLAGQHTTFSRSESLTGNGAISSPPIVTAAIPLTDSFINHISTGDLKSLSVEDVTEWLDSNLSYRIKLLDGTEIYEEDIPDFKISIASAGVKLPDSHEDLPVWGEMMEHLELDENT